MLKSVMKKKSKLLCFIVFTFVIILLFSCTSVMGIERMENAAEETVANVQENREKNIDSYSTKVFDTLQRAILMNGGGATGGSNVENMSNNRIYRQTDELFPTKDLGVDQTYKGGQVYSAFMNHSENPMMYTTNGQVLENFSMSKSIPYRVGNYKGDISFSITDTNADNGSEQQSDNGGNIWYGSGPLNTATGSGRNEWNSGNMMVPGY